MTVKRKTKEPANRPIVKRNRGGKTAARKDQRRHVVPVATALSKKTGKREIVLGLLQRDGGATLEELMTATGWQAHSVRGFLSGTIKKKLGMTVIHKERGASEHACHVEPTDITS